MATNAPKNYKLDQAHSNSHPNQLGPITILNDGVTVSNDSFKFSNNNVFVNIIGSLLVTFYSVVHITGTKYVIDNAAPK